MPAAYDAGRCRETGIIALFNSSLPVFEAIAAQGDQAIRVEVSADTYPDGATVIKERVLNNAEFDADGTVLSARMSYYVRPLPPSPCAPPFCLVIAHCSDSSCTHEPP